MQKRIRSTVPVYLAGVIFFVYALVFPMLRWVDLALALAIAALGFFVLGKIFRGRVVELPKEVTFEKSGDAAVDKLVAEGKSYMQRLTELNALIPDEKVSRQIVHLQEISQQIFDFIVQNPAQVRKVNTFMAYYYPTALKLLESYVEFDNKAVQGDNIRTTLDKISGSLASIETAFAHQLDNLFGDKALDIAADVAVLQDMVQREGLS